MIEQPDKERWKDVVGYEGLYQVSNLGRVKSVDRLTTDKNGRTYTVKGKILNQSKVGDYLRVSLYTNNVARGKLVHRLIAEPTVGTTTHTETTYNPLCGCCSPCGGRGII